MKISLFESEKIICFSYWKIKKTRRLVHLQNEGIKIIGHLKMIKARV